MKIKPEVKPTVFRVGSASGKAERIDTKGGDFNAGVIRGFSAITRGEALGHGLWIDREFLQQVTDAGNAQEAGIKAHFTHGSMSSDGLGTLLGRVKNFRLINDRVLADLHFTEASHQTPDGDLAAYVMKLAKEDGKLFGASIVFSMDEAAMDDHVKKNGGKVKYNRYGDRIVEDFVSPDDDNRKNLEHARLKDLRAADVVDDPAANPNGMFSAEAGRGSISLEAGALLEYALGLSDDAPAEAVLGVHPERAREFLGSFLAERGLTLGQDFPPVLLTAEQAIDDEKFGALCATVEKLQQELRTLSAKYDALRQYTLRLGK